MDASVAGRLDSPQGYLTGLKRIRQISPAVPVRMTRMAPMLATRLQLRLLLRGQLFEHRVMRASPLHGEVRHGPRCPLRGFLQSRFIEFTRERKLMHGLARGARFTGLLAKRWGLGVQDREHAVSLRLAEIQASQETRARHLQTVAAVSRAMPCAMMRVSASVVMGAVVAVLHAGCRGCRRWLLGD